MSMRSREHGFVTLASLVIILIITITGGILMASLLGEVQGGYGYTEAIGAVSVAEAGLHWGGAKLTGPFATTEFYAGDLNQTLLSAGGQTAGMFDVTVTCADGSAVSTGCVAAPNDRLIRAIGYVPSKAGVLGRRTVQALVAQNSFFNKAICAYTSVTFSQGVTVQGDVGSEGSASLQGPSGNAARIQPAPGNVEPGSLYAVGAISCSQGCANQVAGTVNPNQTPGTVCPSRAQVSSSYSCAPGSGTLSGGAVTISAANNSLSTVTLGSGGTVTFQTTGPTNVLTVNVGTITAGSNSQFIVQGGGSVVLNVQGQLTVAQGSFFGVDGSGNVLPADHLIVQSCNTGSPSPAVWFNQTGKLSGVFIVPNGDIKMDQAQLSQGAVLANNITFDQSTGFGFDASASSVGFGFNKLISWQDVP
jgi:hypothetical protein